MSIFGMIKDAILGHASAAPAASPAAAPRAAAPGAPAASAAPVPADAPKSYDVDAILDGLAAKNPGPANYKTSIVDLMKLLGLDSSLANRKQLATELGYTGALDGSAEMNLWLHQKVVERLAREK